MKTLTLLIAIVLLLTPFATAEQRFNASKNRYETVLNNSDSGIRYNASENEYSYQPDGANLELNASENRYEWDSGNNYYENDEYDSW